MGDTGIIGLMKMVLRFLVTLVCAIAGYQTAQFTINMQLPLVVDIHQHVWMAFCVILFTSFGYLLIPFVLWILKSVGQLFENTLQNVGASDIAVSVMGLILSLMIANLIALPFMGIPGIGFYIAVAFNIICAYVGVRAFLKKRDEIWTMFINLFGKGGILNRKEKAKQAKQGDDSDALNTFPFVYDGCIAKKVLDTSAIIDGRILEIASTGFLEGVIVLPRFVLTELQGVADSSDPTKRARGRKGLSVVSDLQNTDHMEVQIHDITMKELNRTKVDEALVVLCKRIGAKIVTTDYNLNQVSRIEGVDVLNVNDLANSLRPQFLPGEQVRIDIIRPGKENGQGVGYLDDGTMLVIEDGESSVGETTDIVITSMIQTSAGRMVFGKLKR